MKPEQLLEGLEKGEISEEQLKEEVQKLSPEDQAIFATKSKPIVDKAVDRIIGARKGAEKLEKEKDGKKKDGEETPPAPAPAPAPEPAKPDPTAQKLRQENYETARDAIFAELGIVKDEEKAAFEEGFKKHDTGSVNVDFIKKDMKAFAASKNSDEYFKLKQEQAEREREAEEWNAQNAGGSGDGGGNGGGKKVSKEVKDFIEASRKRGITLTVEQAEKRIELAKRGGHIG